MCPNSLRTSRKPDAQLAARRRARASPDRFLPVCGPCSSPLLGRTRVQHTEPYPTRRYASAGVRRRMTPENLTLVFVAGSPRKHGGSSCCGAAAAHRASLAPRVARTALPSVARTAPPNVARAFPTSARRMGKRLNFRKAKMGGQPGRRAASSSTSAKPAGAGGRRQLDGVRKSGASSSGYVTPIASRAPSPLGGRQPHASPMSDVASVGSAASPMRVDASGGMPPPPPPPPKNRLLRKAEKHLREIDKLQMQVDAHQLLSGNGMSRLPDACELAKLQTRAATEQQIAALKPAAAAAGCSTPDLAGAVTGAYGALAAPSPRTDEHSRTGASVTRDAAAQRQLLLRPRGRLQGDGRVITDDERRALNVASQRRCRERRAALAPLLAELIRMLADPRHGQECQLHRGAAPRRARAAVPREGGRQAAERWLWHVVPACRRPRGRGAQQCAT